MARNRGQAGRGVPARDRDLPMDAVEEPSWAIPAAVLVVVGILSLGFLAYYFAPPIGEILGHAPKPSEKVQPVDVVIGGTRHLIPSNFTRFAYGRRGGIQDKIELYALLPDFRPYDPAEAAAFRNNFADSRVVTFDIEINRERLTEAERFRQVYVPLATDADGSRGPYGLRRFEFDPTSGYRDEEIFVNDRGDGTIVIFRCFKDLPRVVSPTCRRDLELSDTLALHYRFMRSQLSDWREIDEGVRALASSFQVAAKPQ